MHSHNSGRRNFRSHSYNCHGSKESDQNVSYSQRRPTGLRGREIGMWYAQKSRTARKRAERAVPSIRMNEHEAQNIGTILNSIQSTESSSYNVQSNWKDAVFAIKRKSYGEQYDMFDGSCKSEVDDLCNSFEKIKENRFKHAFLANIRANQLRDSDGLSAVQGENCSLINNDVLNKNLRNDLAAKMTDGKETLPSYKMKGEILSTVHANQVVVISGETGCGKTTQVAQFILEDCIAMGRGSMCHIVCTQPRRISAISVAERVAEERGEKLGKSVGYQIRLDCVSSQESGSVMYCTTGIVLQWLQSDPLLCKISHLILDEIHERNIQSDFLITVARDLLSVRPDLKVILMSATLNADQFSSYFNNCPMLHIPGFTFPVKEFYLEDIIEETRFQFPNEYIPLKWSRKSNKWSSFSNFIQPYLLKLHESGAYSEETLKELEKPCSEEINLQLIITLLLYIAKQPAGAVLIFVPGWEQISKLSKLIEEHGILGGSRFVVFPLHSLMPTINQKEIFRRPPPGTRKIVIATNIAETSITIDDIVYVIDAGKIKFKNFDKDLNVNTLCPEWETLANAHQRKGRAGRVQEGVCYHLYTRRREAEFNDYPLPEVRRTRLEEIILHIKILCLGSVKPFLSRLMEPPDMSVVDISLEFLQTISALDESENLTPLGFHLANLPVDPLTGKMLLMGAIFGCLSPVLTVAACLTFKDPFVVPLKKEHLLHKVKKEFAKNTKSDHMVVVNAFNEWQKAREFGNESSFLWKNFLSASVLHQIKNMRKQFVDLLYDFKFIGVRDAEHSSNNRNSNNYAVVRAIVASGLYPNVIRILPGPPGKPRKRPPVMMTKSDRRVELHLKSVNADEITYEASWLVYMEKIKSSKVFVHDSTMIPNYPLVFFGQKLNYIHNERVIDIDGFVKVRCPEEIASVIQNLREELDNLFEYKITQPGPAKWDLSTKEGVLLQTIIDLLTSEKYVPPSEEALPPTERFTCSDGY